MHSGQATTQSSDSDSPVELFSPVVPELPDPPLSPVELPLELEFELSVLSDWLFEESLVVVLRGRVVDRGGLGFVMTLRSGVLK